MQPTSEPLSLLRALAKQILTATMVDGLAFRWELWRTGMLRLDLDNDIVLHVWDDRFRHDGVTMIHDHPWDLHSTVLAGELTNVRYELAPTASTSHDLAQSPTTQTFWQSHIQCGVGACTLTEPRRVYLTKRPPQLMSAGGWYRQAAAEVHETIAECAVTVVTRTFHEERDNANVYIADGLEWGDAAPRPARHDEVRKIVRRALQVF